MLSRQCGPVRLLLPLLGALPVIVELPHLRIRLPAPLLHLLPLLRIHFLAALAEALVELTAARPRKCMSRQCSAAA